MNDEKQLEYVISDISAFSEKAIKFIYAEGRETWENVEAEAVQAIAMILRFLVEGDGKNGIVSPHQKDTAINSEE